MSEIATDVVAAGPIADRLQAGFERRIADFAVAARRAGAGTDPEAIHDLRVAARRLLAALKVWRGLVPARECRAAIRELRRLRRRAGKARELEVHVELLEARMDKLDDVTRASAAAMLADMNERLVRLRRRAAGRVRPKRLKRVFRLLESLAGGVSAWLLRDPHAIDAALRVEHEEASRARAALRHAREGGDEALHEARIAAKKWRYAIECVEDAVPGASSRHLEELRGIQAVVGVIHDCALLRDALRHRRRDIEPGRGPAALEPLIEGLDMERRRAVLEFQRLAGALGEPPDASGGDMPANATGSVALAGGESREERWDRIARWLANAADAPVSNRAETTPPTAR